MSSYFDSWWDAVCQKATEKLDFSSSLLPVTNRDGSQRLLTWRNGGEDSEIRDVVKTILPVRDRRQGGPLRLTVEVRANRSIESVGRRMTLFSRPVEEYSAAKPVQSE